ncbi:hypothetical protein AV530_019950 [Patagioenas fasciata monilis]|uniref:Uncharacterized protein n=1 Tax=Patagioenas fasciata monilis TaxID=372326 RepID=A0A1V4JHK5_PATFA|nr:hypothetical protein AV530_019950 [Patagioenas fasciata monilis]
MHQGGPKGPADSLTCRWCAGGTNEPGCTAQGHRERGAVGSLEWNRSIVWRNGRWEEAQIATQMGATEGDCSGGEESKGADSGS